MSVDNHCDRCDGYYADGQAHQCDPTDRQDAELSELQERVEAIEERLGEAPENVVPIRRRDHDEVRTALDEMLKDCNAGELRRIVIVGVTENGLLWNMGGKGGNWELVGALEQVKLKLLET